MKVIKSGQDVYSVFEATNKTSQKQDIFLSVSHDNGKTYNVTGLSNGVVRFTLKDEKPKPVENSSNPQIAMDKQGGIYIAWNAKGAGNPSYVVLAISEDKFRTPVVPLVNMTDKNIPGYEPTLINDQENGDVNLYYIMRDQGTGDPCKTRCS